MTDGRLSMHFGHCEQFALLETDESGSIHSEVLLDAPPHEPGALPAWLHEQGAGIIIAGGMGMRAQQLFAQNGIEAIVGAPAGTPRELVTSYLGGTLQTGENVCDH